ncbi:hypothetical protein EV121DRAFT_297928 [Schizophyllum commune]
MPAIFGTIGRSSSRSPASRSAACTFPPTTTLPCSPTAAPSPLISVTSAPPNNPSHTLSLPQGGGMCPTRDLQSRARFRARYQSLQGITASNTPHPSHDDINNARLRAMRRDRADRAPPPPSPFPIPITTPTPSPRLG